MWLVTLGYISRYLDSVVVHQVRCAMGEKVRSWEVEQLRRTEDPRLIKTSWWLVMDYKTTIQYEWLMTNVGWSKHLTTWPLKKGVAEFQSRLEHSSTGTFNIHEAPQARFEMWKSGWYSSSWDGCIWVHPAPVGFIYTRRVPSTLCLFPASACLMIPRLIIHVCSAYDSDTSN